MTEVTIPTRTDRYKVYSYHADHTRHLTLVSLAKFLQETAGEHAEDLGVGFTKFKEMNIAWVLYKQVIKMEQWPLWGEEVIVKTWPTVAEKLFCYRDFEIFNSAEELIGKVSTSWIVINLENRRPMRTSKYYDLPQTEWNSVNFPVEIKNKLTNDKDPDCVRSYKVQLQDIDMNNHVNNTCYIDWAFNYYQPEFLAQHKLLGVEIQFQLEAVYGDEVQLETVINSKTKHDHIIKRNGKMLVHIRLEWEIKGNKE